MRLHLPLALALMPLLAQQASAQPLTLVTGKVGTIYADPSDLVIFFSAAGPCGSNFFHVKRTAANFREMTEIVLMAFQTGRPMGLNVKSCQGDRNVLSHGYVTT